MTCIIGLLSPSGTWIGGDSAGVGGLSLVVRKDEKVFFINGRFLLGYTSSFRMGQLLRFGFVPPEQKKKQSDFEYLCTDFIDAVRQRLKTGGYLTIKDNEERGGTFLLAYKSGLYEISDNFQVGIPVDPYGACGCGDEIALGSLYSTAQDNDPKRRMLTALQAAERFSAGVRRPFVIKFLSHKTRRGA